MQSSVEFTLLPITENMNEKSVETPVYDKKLFLTNKQTYRFPSLFTGGGGLRNREPWIPKPAFHAQIKLILAQNSSFPSLFAVFESVNSQNREYWNRE